MRLIEEEAQLRLGLVADLGKLLEQLGQKPQQEGRIEPRARHQPVGGKDVDEPPAILVDLEEILEVDGGLTEEAVAALAPKLQQRALDRPDRRLRNIAVSQRELVGALA